MTRLYASLTDRNYLPRLLAMYHSLVKHSSVPFELRVLAMDAETDAAITALNLPGLTVTRWKWGIRGSDHTWQERCWLMASQWSEVLMILQTVAEAAEVTYLDADLFFFSDPEIVHAEIGDRKIAIIPHRFEGPKIATNGRFNVSWVTFKGLRGLHCARLWAHQCREWCIGEGSLVHTGRGLIPIEDVTAADVALTRKGFFSVQHVTRIGIKRTLKVRTDSSELSCTEDHLIFTDNGWRRADSLNAGDLLLTAHSGHIEFGCGPNAFPAVPSPIRADVGIGGGIGMAARASSLFDLRFDMRSPSHVFPMADNFEMGGIYARTIPANMVEFRSRRNGANQINIGQPVGQHHAVRDAVNSSVAVCRETAVPDQAFARSSGPRMNPLVGNWSKVVSVSHGAIMPVYDIGINGPHEFFANGILVHNCYNRVEPGRFGDQKFLDEWPQRYGDDLCIIQNIGAGTAPWNLQQYRVTDGPTVDGVPCIFYHLHEYQHGKRLTNYPLRPEDKRLIYEPYIAAYEQAKQQIESVRTPA